MSVNSQHRPDPALSGLLGTRLMAALATMFNVLALNLALLIASLPLVTLPVAINAAAVALDRSSAFAFPRLGRGNQRFDLVPFFITQISWIFRRMRLHPYYL